MATPKHESIREMGSSWADIHTAVTEEGSTPQIEDFRHKKV